MRNYYKFWLGSLCLVTIISAHTWALFGFGDSDTSIAPFVPSSSIDNASVNLAQSAMNLLGQTSKSSLSSLRPQGIPLGAKGAAEGGGVWDTNNLSINGNAASSILSYDIIAAVQSSDDKSQTITNHLSELQTIISQLTQASNQYQSQITQAQALMDGCTTDKKASDAAVIAAINSNKLNNIDSLIQASVTAGQCEVKNRITINALSLIIKKQNQSIASLNQKSTLIEQYKSTIIQYPEVISDPKIIQELSQISSQF